MEVILAGGFGHNVEVILGEADELTRAAATLLSEISRQNAGVSLLITVLCECVFEYVVFVCLCALCCVVCVTVSTCEHLIYILNKFSQLSVLGVIC